MIHVTQGHERSIALEIFIKSYLLLSKPEQKKFTLHCNEETWLKSLKTNRLSEDLFKNLNLIFLNSTPQASASLTSALDNLDPDQDILLTLPTTKDQLVLNDEIKAGYTEFLRAYYQVPQIAMLFAYHKKRVLLLTDHIPLNEVSKTLSSDFIIKKVAAAIEGHNKFFYPFKEVIFSGINPHAGENGQIGTDENEINLAIKELHQIYPNVSFRGPISGDTMHTIFNDNSEQLFIYAHHDQGLAPFKQKYGLLGLNISLGLPFLRMSVDHGTAFSLYGKNQAHCLGCHYMLKSALEISLGKTYGHQ